MAGGRDYTSVMSSHNDIGWRQLAVSTLELIRWPIVVIVTVLLLRQPLEQLVHAIAMAIRT